jgi:hypothetical protein
VKIVDLNSNVSIGSRGSLSVNQYPPPGVFLFSLAG